MRRTVLVLLTIMTLLLSACGTADTATPSASPASGDAVASPAPSENTDAAPSADAGAPQPQRVGALLEYQGENTDDVVTLPTTAKAGQAFQITITSFGGGCESVGGADVKVEGMTATIDVYDMTVAGPAVSCTMELKRLPRTVDVTFAEAGNATIKINGIKSDGSPVTIEKTITVE